MKNYVISLIVMSIISIVYAEKWTAYYASNSGIPEGAIRDVLEDSKGNMIFVGNYGAVSTFDGSKWSRDNGAQAVLNEFSFMSCIDKNDNLWLASKYNGVAMRKNDLWYVFDTSNCEIVQNKILSVYCDSKNNVWFSSRHALSIYNNGTWTVLDTNDNHLLKDSHISSIYEYNNTMYFAAPKKGFITYRNGGWGRVDTNSILPSNNVSVMYINSEGVKYYATTDRGVLVQDKNNKLTVFNVDNSPIYGIVFSISEDVNGHMWFVAKYETSKTGVLRYDGNQWTIYTKENTFGGLCSIYKIYADSKDNMWFYGGIGASKYEAKISIISGNHRNMSKSNKNLITSVSKNAIAISTGSQPVSTIYNLQGKMLKRFHNKHNLDISDLATGNYLLNTRYGGGKSFQSVFNKTN